MATKLVTLECKHTKKVPNDSDVWIRSLVRCSECKNLKKVIVIRA